MTDFTIAITTFKRPEYLSALLSDLSAQEMESALGKYELLVCDNDPMKSAKGIVAGFQSSKFTRIDYFVGKDPKSLSLNRNKLIEEAKGTAIIFLDDDQGLPKNFFSSVEAFWSKWGNSISIAKFQRFPKYESTEPTWTRRGNFFHWPLPKEGEELNGEAGAGYLFKLSDVRKYKLYFDPCFVGTVSGGEDLDVFLRAKAQGASVVSAPSICVFEKIPASRESARHLLKRDFYRSTSYGFLIRRGDLGGTDVVNFVTLISKLSISFLLIPLSIVGGPLTSLKSILFCARQCGKLLGFCGVLFK